MGWVPDHIWYAQKKGKGKGGGGGGAMQVLQALLGGGGGGGWGKGGGKGRRSGCKEVPEKRMWIGNLPTIPDREKRMKAEKELKEILKAGGECKFASIMGGGNGVATFPSKEEVQAAIAALAGTEFQGKVLEFDTWEKQS
mmetsp:Transcript_58580/g.93021  ORF Transcript_58580/g.93021 Transcript_58580/m.93021 type:complete len:140 (-) Transcript_58580:127-546(-)